MTAPAAVHPAKRAGAGPAGVFGWLMFDWAQQPFNALITTFLFAPYFAKVFVGDQTEGFALWGYTMGAAGLIVALLTPIFGAIADETGRLKRWIVGFSFLFVAGQSALYFAYPGAAHLVFPIAAAVIVAAVSAEFASAFNNAMIPAVVSRERYGRLSGAGWAIGYAGGLVSILIVTGVLLAGPGEMTLLGHDLRFELDAASHQAERLVGPFSAVWYIVFVLPLLLFTPDLPKRDVRMGDAVSRGLRELRRTVSGLPRMPDLLRFLIARMLYTDGLLAVFAFGGIYAVSLFGWSTAQLGIFGLIITVAAALGAFAGGFLDDWLGAKPVIIGALLLLITGLTGVLMIDPGLIEAAFGEGAFSGIDIAGFTRPAEFLYLGFSVLIGLASGPLQSASRSLLARMAPRDRIAEYFGLYAFSGKITAFAAPILIGAVTTVTGNEKYGLGVILVFLLAGLAVFLRVRVDRAEAQG